MNLSGSGDAPSLGFTNQIADFSEQSDRSGKRRWGGGQHYSVFSVYVQVSQGIVWYAEISQY